MEIKYLGADSWKADIALAFCFEDEKMQDAFFELEKKCPWLENDLARKDFNGKKDSYALFYGNAEDDLPRVLAGGLGKKEAFSMDILREAVAAAMQKCRKLGMKTVLLPFALFARLTGGQERLIEESVCAAFLALYRFTELKTEKDSLDPDPEWLGIAFEDDISDYAKKSAKFGQIAASAIALARNLDNLPGNMLYPEIFALRALSIAEEYGFSCEILAEEALEKENMGCLLAVGRGSVHAPRLVVLEYAPKGHEQEKPVILAGKGITFDSGGICIKPAAGMMQMKCDMSGAAAVLAAITALAAEKADIRVVGILACAENLPDGKAYRPGDVLVSASGKTVEVINTDAEGRLALCDALAYAQKRWTPSVIIDIATLTGACAVALGTDLAGLFCDDHSLAERLMAAGRLAGENFWQLPLWGKYDEQLKSEVADMKHTGAREGGAITAALFLRRFIKEGELWAHMDIAGVDWNSKPNALCPEGPTGFGVRTLLEFCRGRMHES